MFAITTARMAELSLSDSARHLREYARLEFPHEDLHWLVQIADVAAQEREALPPRWHRFFGHRLRPRERISAKA